MLIIGVCGGSGSGKSTVAKTLVSRGAALFDADAYYHALVASNGPCMQEICSLLGKDAQCDDGSLNRPYVASIVFAPNQQGRKLLSKLNAITHAYVRQGYLEWVASLEQDTPYVVIDAPLLYEGAMDVYCDAVIAVVAQKAVRIRRIVERDGISCERAQARIDAQVSDPILAEKADYVIDNSFDLAHLNEQIDKILTILTNKKGNKL